jgi:hypothetical protein
MAEWLKAVCFAAEITFATRRGPFMALNKKSTNRTAFSSPALGLGLLGAAVLFAISSPIRSSPTQASGSLPSAQQVLDRYVEVTGGKEALLRHKSMTVHGRYQAPQEKLDVETTFYTKDGTKMVLKATLPGGKEYATGYDGETAWTLGTDGSVDLPEGDVVKTVARDADMYYHLHVLQYFKSMEVAGVEPFNGRPCYHLKGINNWGKLNEQFYDQETGLLLGYRFNTEWRGGKGDASETFEDYRDFGGVKMAAKTTSRDGDDVSVSLVTAVTYDDVSDEIFVLPDAVKKALAAKKASK